MNAFLARCLCVALLAQVSGAAAAEGEGSPLALSGQFKNVLLTSRPWLGGDRYTFDLARLRLQAQGEITPGVEVDLQLDHELLTGSYLHTAEFRQAHDAPPPQFWDPEARLFAHDNAEGSLRLYRGAVTFGAGPWDLRIGRQRIAWGTGRFWSPLDILNPVSALALEREERLGVDAVLAEWRAGPLSRLSLVFAPRREPGLTSRALQWHANAAGVDYSLVAGRLSGLEVLGTDMATQIGDTGVRAEVAHLRPRSGEGGAFWRLTVGVDHAFANTLTLSAELHHNGAGRRDPREYDVPALLSGRTLTLATRYAGLYASYELTPLLKWTQWTVFNLDDHSRAVDSRLTWSVRPDIDLGIGLQRFGGRRGAEYAMPRGSTFVQLQWYF